MFRNARMTAILAASVILAGVGGASHAAKPRGFTCLGTALPEKVINAPIPEGWVEQSLEEARRIMPPTLSWETINTTIPDLSATDKQRGYTVFVRNWGDVVFPQTAPLPDEMKDSFAIFASPGEYEPVSFCVRALRQLKNVRVTVDKLTGPRGRQIGSENVDVRIVRCLPTKLFNNKKEYVIRPRILEKQDAMDISADTTQQYWLTVYVPETARPGKYSAQIAVQPENADSASLTLTLDVLPISLKPSPTRHYMYAYMFGRPLEHSILVKNLVNMREHGMTGGFFGPEFNPDIKEEDGKIVVNIEEFKGLLKECQEIGLLDPFIYSPAGVTLGVWGEEKFAEIYRQIFEQIKEAGLPMPILTYGDESDHDEVRKADTTKGLQIIKENIPGAITYTTVLGSGSVGIFDPWLDYYAFSSYADKTTMDAMKKKGKEFWMYSGPGTYGMGPVADRFYRGFYARRMNLKAAGEWVYQWPVVITPNPNDRLRDFTEARPHGNAWDYCLPGPDGPLPSLGWEGYREGIDDSRYVATLESAISEAGKSEDASLRQEAQDAKTYLDKLLSRIDLSPSYPEFGVLRESAKFTNSELNECRRKIAEHIVTLQGNEK